MKKLLIIVSSLLLMGCTVSHATEYRCPQSVTCSTNWYTSCNTGNSDWRIKTMSTSYELRPGAVYEYIQNDYHNDPFYYNSLGGNCMYQDVQSTSSLVLETTKPVIPIMQDSQWKWTAASMYIAYCLSRNPEDCKFTDA